MSNEGEGNKEASTSFGADQLKAGLVIPVTPTMGGKKADKVSESGQKSMEDSNEQVPAMSEGGE